MCTVSFLPTRSGFIMSSNRDESPNRSETPIVQEKIGDRIVTYPRDVKGGSWIFHDDWNRVLIVLNGAFEKHAHLPPYRKSRGLIGKDYFTFTDSIDFFRNLDLNGIEPFTMIIMDAHQLYEFRWDEKIKHINLLSTDQAYIWSSSTLYSREVQRMRENWFFDHLPKEIYYNLEIARELHRNGDIGDSAQNYIMNRDGLVKTVSISHLEVKDGNSALHYESLNW